MSNRKSISIEDTMAEVYSKMSEGNPGGLSVVLKLLERDPIMGFMDLLTLDDMNIRGSQLWVAYKDYAKCDVEKLHEALSKRDPAMVAAVNQEFSYDPTSEKAVESGASFNR